MRRNGGSQRPERGLAMAEQLIKVPSLYAEARCILPGCGEPLHMTWTASTSIYLSDTDDKLRGPGPGNVLTLSWEVSCEGGHIVLLPADTAGDWYEFAGPCTCNPDYPDPERERVCAHNDMARLRAVVLPEVAAGSEPGHG
jgi:hypothetical protein